MRYVFGDTVLDTTRYTLYRNDEPEHVEPQVFDVLAHLVQNRDRVVSKNELLDQVWGHQFVTESALTTRIKQCRQAVGDTGKDQKVVQTIHGRGYRFIAPVEEVPDAVERPVLEVPEELHQDIHFCTADDGTRLAFATIGSGPPLVRAAHWITHLDYDWQSPVWRHWLVGLARNRTLVRYDERGNGLSDHDVDDFSFEAMVRDLETVVDELGLERFPILGLSQGGAIAVTYAAAAPGAGQPSHPGRRVLRGAAGEGADRRRDPRGQHADRDGPPRLGEGRPRLSAVLRRAVHPRRLGRVVGRVRGAAAPHDVADERGATARSRGPTSMCARRAREVQAPTLVLHARDDMSIPWEQGRLFASLIPGARLVPLSSRNHLLREDEPAWTQLLSEIDSFLST